MKKLWKWLFGTRKQQCNIHDVSVSVCCENCKHKTPRHSIICSCCLRFRNFEAKMNANKEIKSFKGPIIAMGRKVERELKKHQIEHHYIHHPAARGKIRIIENYKAHVREQIGHVFM